MKNGIIGIFDSDLVWWIQVNSYLSLKKRDVIGGLFFFE